MDEQLHDTSSFEYAFSVAQQRHKDTVNELHRLREELRAREDVIKCLRARLGHRFDAELECRLLNDQLKKLQEGLRKVVGEDETPLKMEATPGGSSAAASATQVPVKKAKNCVAKLPLEYLADILSFLDRFSMDRTVFTCSKLRAAVATLDGQNLRGLHSLRLGVTGSIGEDWGCIGRSGWGAAAMKYLTGHADTPFTIVVERSSHTMAQNHGAITTAVKLTWDFIGTAKATPHFVGLLRNASVRQLSLSGPFTHHFIQALSAAGVDVAVGSMTANRFVPEGANLPVACEALIPFNRLETLDVNDAPLGSLSDDFLLMATQKRVMSIELKSPRFHVHDAGDWGWTGANTRSRREVHVPDVASVSELIYPELCDGLLAYLFRDDLDSNATVELHFPAARIPPDFCLRLMETAISAGTGYSIDASFVAVNGIDEQLPGFEGYRGVDDAQENCVTYQVPDPNVADVIVELKITAVESIVKSQGWNAPPTSWKLIEFRRFRKIDG